MAQLKVLPKLPKVFQGRMRCTVYGGDDDSDLVNGGRYTTIIQQSGL